MNADERFLIDIHTHAGVSVRMAPDEAAARAPIMKENAVKLLKLKGGA
jgi:hypothetical protein